MPLLRNAATGEHKLHKKAPHPTDPNQTLRAAQLHGNSKANELLDVLAQDPHLQAFIIIPGKDDGLDIEGLAMAPTGQLFMGQRGPMLRG